MLRLDFTQMCHNSSTKLYTLSNHALCWTKNYLFYSHTLELVPSLVLGTNMYLETYQNSAQPDDMFNGILVQDHSTQTFFPQVSNYRRESFSNLSIANFNIRPGINNGHRLLYQMQQLNNQSTYEYVMEYCIFKSMPKEYKH